MKGLQNILKCISEFCFKPRHLFALWINKFV